MHHASDSSDDPVRHRRQVIAVWTRRANQMGYLFFLLAIILFIIAFTTDFSGALAALVTAS